MVSFIKRVRYAKDLVEVLPKIDPTSFSEDELTEIHYAAWQKISRFTAEDLVQAAQQIEKFDADTQTILIEQLASKNARNGKSSTDNLPTTFTDEIVNCYEKNYWGNFAFYHPDTATLKWEQGTLPNNVIGEAGRNIHYHMRQDGEPPEAFFDFIINSPYAGSEATTI